MKSKKRLKLAIVMIVTAIIISFAIATTNYLRQKDHTIENHERLISQTETSVENSIQAVEKAYAVFEQELSKELNSSTDFLMDLYEENPSFETWNYDELREVLGTDIYILNEENKIIHSNVVADIHLDFTECCPSLSDVLDDRRASGNFYEDGIDIEQETGEIKKYSYQATPDKKYIIELGINLENGAVFQSFNFLDVVENLLAEQSSINDINIVHSGGIVFGKSAEEGQLSGERIAALKEALATNEKVEFDGEWQDEFAMYRYIPYESAYETGMTKHKVIEVIYNDRELQSVLKRNLESFIFQLVTVLGIITIISFIIHQWVKKQVHMAYHDGLTKLKNRTAFEEYISEALDKSGDTTTGIMMLDLDNFKLVNDYLGHDKGDHLLFVVAQTLYETVKAKGEVFRLGGDEFVIVIPKTTTEAVEAVAEDLLIALDQSIQLQKDLIPFHITASMGICFAPMHSNYPDMLYKKADIALYHAKEKGKNQYCIYEADVLKNERNIII